ncbi:MAG: hypothetical protein E6R13_00550 [Spirochaetes bacterium]|nr:MAG: hypothetical protein E6R13_00550 [Spirochaetota bacterium]
MKTENTLENKRKFFAQYWGQKILLHVIDVDDILLLLNNEIDNDIKNWLLYLKPVSQISDEDAINLGYGYASHLKSNLDRNIDQLRNLGYALPWMDLSVEDLVEYGWVKLKED